MELDTYPLLRAAILEMAYDNGVINRTETEEDFLARMDELIFEDEGFPEDTLYEVESTLEKLSVDDRQEFVIGEVDTVLESNEGMEDELDHASSVLAKIFEMI